MSLQNCKRCTFLDNLKAIFQERNMKTRQMTPFYLIYFFCSNCLCHLFLNLKILKTHFHMVFPSVHSGPLKTSIFGQKLPMQTAHHTFLEIRHPEITKNLYQLLSTRPSQMAIFFRFQLIDYRT